MKRIMIVEDSEETLSAISYLLKRSNYNVVATAMDGEDAVEEFKRTKPDIMLLDLALPKKDGLDVIKEILAKNIKAKIIVISALYNPDYRKKAMSAGCKEFILKPFEVHELLLAIERTLAT
jgi:two-component system chemotaxis response regulator CheY